MYHLVPVTLRYPVEVAFVLVAGFPVCTFLIAIAHEFARGIQQFNQQLLHVAYDSSYVLSLLGICLILRAVIKRKQKIHVLVATLVAAIPLGYILTTQP
jgi:uncharacterized membrane protein YbaN (DUF454 family)